MQKRRNFFVYFAASLLSGCAVSSGVVPLGPDTFSIEVNLPPSLGASADARRIALTNASQYCNSLGRQMVVISTNSTRTREASGLSVNFRCLQDGDPDLRRPNIQPAPNAVIEVR